MPQLVHNALTLIVLNVVLPLEHVKSVKLDLEMLLDVQHASLIVLNAILTPLNVMNVYLDMEVTEQYAHFAKLINVANVILTLPLYVINVLNFLLHTSLLELNAV